jgi:uncharacterized YigZ family protein
MSVDKTPLSASVYERHVLSSRFIALLFPLQDEGDINILLQKARDEYPKATHYCYAATIGSYEKCSDDGEPPHSAGIPLLTALKQNGVSSALLVLVRYFGGAKLGLGRLTRTYRECAQSILTASAYCRLEEGREYVLSLSYSHFEELKAKALKTHQKVEAIVYEEKVRLLLRGDANITASLVQGLPEGSLIQEKSVILKKELEQP